MLAAVKDASRRPCRWPLAILDRHSARRPFDLRPGRGNAGQPNKEPSFRKREWHFAELDGHNFASLWTVATAGHLPTTLTPLGGGTRLAFFPRRNTHIVTT